MINDIKCFFQVYKYATTKFTIINRLVKTFTDRNKGKGSRTFFL